MPRIVFVNRFFHPDESATSQMLTDLVFCLTRKDFQVVVVTSNATHDAAKSKLKRRDTLAGVQIHRVPTTRFGRSTVIGRTFDYLGFYMTATGWLLRNINADDVIVVKTDPPLLSVPAGWAARFRKAVLINWLQDIYPETAVELDIFREGGFVHRVLKKLRDRSLHQASQNIVIGNLMGKKIAELGAPEDRVRVIPNWADGSAIKPIDPSDNPLRKQWFNPDDFVVGYSGNMGRAHDLGALLDAAQQIQKMGIDADSSSAKRIRFLFIGDGHQRNLLESAAKSRGLNNVRFEPFQPRTSLAMSLGVADLHIVSLKPGLEGLIVPSKFYGVLAAGRPVLFIGAPQGEISHEIFEGKCGDTVPHQDVESLRNQILSYAVDAEKTKAHGASARLLFENRFSLDRACATWSGLLNSFK